MPQIKVLDESLVELLERVPDERFWRDKPGGVPHYRSIYSYVLEQKYPDGIIPVSDIMEEHFPHPSSFQRFVPLEANRRRPLIKSGKGGLRNG